MSEEIAMSAYQKAEEALRLNANLTQEVESHLAECATYTVGTWTAELKIDGIIVVTATGYYYKIGDVYVMRIPTLNYIPESPITPNTGMSIGGFPNALSNFKNHPIGGWIAGVGIIALNGIYIATDNSLHLTIGNPVVDYKPTIPTGEGCIFVGADIIG